MAKKTPEQIIFESWKDSRYSCDFFKSLSDDAIVGYMTGMTIAQNPNIGISPEEVYKLVQKVLFE